MKKLLLFSALVLYSGLVLSNKVIITNSGNTFSPDSISINVGDTVDFQLQNNHNAVEVSQAVWNANGNTPLPGFSVSFGGGEVTGLATGIHYYVCSPHASLGMKGRIFVTSGLGINAIETNSGNIRIYPNPTDGKFSLQIQESGIFRSTNQEIRLDIYNFLGENIFCQTNLLPQTIYDVDLTSFPDGVYFLSFADGKKTNSVRIVKR